MHDELFLNKRYPRSFVRGLFPFQSPAVLCTCCRSEKLDYFRYKGNFWVPTLFRSSRGRNTT